MLNQHEARGICPQSSRGLRTAVRCHHLGRPLIRRGGPKLEHSAKSINSNSSLSTCFLFGFADTGAQSFWARQSRTRSRRHGQSAPSLPLRILRCLSLFFPSHQSTFCGSSIMISCCRFEAIQVQSTSDTAGDHVTPAPIGASSENFNCSSLLCE
jgi:hypothetical protein